MKKDKDGKDTDKPVTVTDGGDLRHCPKHGETDFLLVGAVQVCRLLCLPVLQPRPSCYKHTQEEPLDYRGVYFCLGRGTLRQLMNKKFDLVTRKGVYPYEYMDSFDRFEEKELPTQVIH